MAEPRQQKVGDFILLQTIGSGAAGKVRLARKENTDELVAIKIIKKSSLEADQGNKNKIHREIGLMRFLDHPNCIRLIDICESQRHLYIILEYASKGDLLDLVVKEDPMMDEKAMDIFRQIIYGLDYLHTHSICHRDLKLENILIDHADRVKIADFGFARMLKTDFARTACGTPQFVAPEILKGMEYDGKKADVWSTGVILYTLLTKKFPFDDDNVRRAMHKVRSGVFAMPETHPLIQDLLARILTVAPDSRLSVHEIKKHEAFTLFLPKNYVLPCPFSITPPGSVVLTEDKAEFPKILMQMGFESVEEVEKELASEDNTLAKMFYWMIYMGGSLSKLPWEEEAVVDDKKDEIPPLLFEPEIPQSQKIIHLSTSDTFSLTDPTPWLSIDIVSDDQPSESFENNVNSYTEFLMSSIQQIVCRNGFSFLHPDEMQLVCRRLNPLAYISVYCTPIERGILKVQVDRYGGYADELVEITELLSSQRDTSL